MTSSGNIPHSEVWDDSLLVDSWNEALKEYKQYHSIHSRGERVEDVLKDAENQSNGIGKQADYEEGEIDQHEHYPHAKMRLPEETVDNAASVPDVGSKVENPEHLVSNRPPRSTLSNDSALPQHLIGQIHDESLKNLLMSWYYAGYYTGLYEGQRQGAASKDA